MEVQKVKISDLKPNPKNKFQIPKGIKKLRRILGKYNAKEPIIYNKRSGRIISGFYRLIELKYKGEKNTEIFMINIFKKDENNVKIAIKEKTGKIQPIIDYDLIDYEKGIMDLENS